MKSKLLTILHLISATIAIPVLGATTGIQARLDIAPAHVLPGLPAMFIVSLSNRDTAAHSIANVLRLRVTPASGAEFVVRWGSVREDSGVPGAPDVVVLAPGQTRELFFPATETLMNNEAFWDVRLTVPGTYDLRMDLGDGFDISTSTVRLKVDQPSGDDLAVWQLMQQKSGGGWPVDRWLGDTIASKFPRSTYARATIFLSAGSQLRSLLPAAIDGLSGPTRDDLRLLLISQLQDAASKAFHAGDRKSGNDLTKQALQQIDQLRKEAVTAYASGQADEALARITAGSAIRDADPNMRYRKLIPLAACRDNDGTLLFGYQNDNKWPIVKHVGGDNHFDPSPGDRGQTTVFQPGKHKKAFIAAVLPNEVLKWILDDNVASLTASAAKKCSDEDD